MTPRAGRVERAPMRSRQTSEKKTFKSVSKTLGHLFRTKNTTTTITKEDSYCVDNSLVLENNNREGY
jgi:hypothetical protein